MTLRNQRIAQRKRRERNQRLWWLATDIFSLMALCMTFYIVMMILYAMGG